MRFFKILLMVVLAFYLSGCTDKRTTFTEPELAKENLLIAIDKFNKAFQEGDVKVLESMITDNYLHTNGNSKAINKKDWLNYLHTRERAIKSGNLEVIKYEIDEMEIEFYGNMALVTGKVIVSTKKKEEIQNNEYRITNVWVNESGNWKRAGFHDGKIK